MTHDELLAKIERQDEYIPRHPMRDALLAVVELHKPMLAKYTEFDIDRYECQVCREAPYYSLNAAYPCLTIQAIERELV